MKFKGIFFYFFLFLAPSWVQASPRDSFGLDADSTARAMAVTASASPRAAAGSNPARLIATRGIEVAFDLTVATDELSANGTPHDDETYVGYLVQAAMQIPLGRFRDRLFVGLNAHIPHNGLYQVVNSKAAEPVFWHTGSDARRFSFDAALAVRIWEQIAIGAGITLMPTVSADVHVDFSHENSASRVEVDYHVAPVIGVYAEVIEGLKLGFSYRGEAHLELDVPATIDISENIGEVNAHLAGEAYAEPHLFSLGVAFDTAPYVASKLARLAAEIDFEYRIYQTQIATSADVQLFGESAGADVNERVEWSDFENAWSLRAAVSWMPLDEFTFSLGYAFEKTPVPAQRSVFNVLDADRHQCAFGASYWLPQNWLGGWDIGFSTAAKFDFYDTRDMEKYEFLVDNPGFPSMRFRGWAMAWHASIMMRFQ